MSAKGWAEQQVQAFLDLLVEPSPGQLKRLRECSRADLIQLYARRQALPHA